MADPSKASGGDRGGMRKRPAAAGGAPTQSSVGAFDNGRAAAGAVRSAPRWLPLLPLSFVLFCFGLLALTWVRHVLLPAPRGLEAPLDQFSEARARVHLESLTGFGIRMTGSPANELLAVRYLLTTLADMQRDLASRPQHAAQMELQVELQRPSGSFDLDFLNGFSSSYTNVTNVIARLAPKGRRAHGDDDGEEGGAAAGGKSVRGGGATLMVSAHFDSAPGTAAATDDAANCANMLEVLRALTHRPAGALDGAVLFLWNGAEETILQAAHGFITQHRWSRDVAAFINLEGAGGSGRELVFQTGPKHQWLADAYSRVAPYPFASILGQDIFQSGAIPSDTDFRIYRDFGEVPGIDVAYIDRGYIYHTALDRASAVSSGALQRCGDNLQATVQELANSPYLALAHRGYRRTCHPRADVKDVDGGNNKIGQLVDAYDSAAASGMPSPLSEHDLRAIVAAHVCLDVTHETQTGAVYFDVLGFFVIIYSSATSLRLNSVVLLIVVGYLVRQALRRRALGTALQGVRGFPTQVGLTLLSFVCAIASAALVGGVLSFLAPMSWFSNSFLVGGLFVVPAMLTFAQLQRTFFADVGVATERKALAPAGEDVDAPALPAAASNVDRASRADFTQPAWLRAAFEREEAAYDASLAIWAVLLLGLTIAKVGSAFLSLSWALLPLFARSVARRVEIVLYKSTTPRRGKTAAGSTAVTADAVAPKGPIFLCGFMAGLVLPSILFLQSSLVVFNFFVPLMGRSGTVVPSDVLIGVLFSTLLAVGALMTLSVVHLLCNWSKVRRALACVFVASMLFALAPKTGFPFTPDTPKRLYMVHLAREMHPRGHDSHGDVRGLLGDDASIPAVASTAAVSAAAASKLSEGAQLRALRSQIRDSTPTHTTGLWLLSMDYVGMKPLRDIRVPAALLGREVASSSSSAGGVGAVDADGRVGFLDGAQVQACSLNATETRGRLFGDLPFYLPLPTFVPGNVLIPLPAESMAASESLRPQLSLERVEEMMGSGTTTGPDGGAVGVGLARRRRLYFRVTNGPSHMTLYINNRKGLSRVRQWSFGDSAVRSLELGRDSLGQQYELSMPDELFVYFASGMTSHNGAGAAGDEAAASRDRYNISVEKPLTSSSPSLPDASALLSLLPADSDSAEGLAAFVELKREWEFWLEIADDVEEEGGSSKSANEDTKPFLDLALAGHYFARHRNPIALSLLPHMPKWLSPIFFTSFHDSFQL